MVRQLYSLLFLLVFSVFLNACADSQAPIAETVEPTVIADLATTEVPVESTPHVTSAATPTAEISLPSPTGMSTTVPVNNLDDRIIGTWTIQQWAEVTKDEFDGTFTFFNDGIAGVSIVGTYFGSSIMQYEFLDAETIAFSEGLNTGGQLFTATVSVLKDNLMVLEIDGGDIILRDRQEVAPSSQQPLDQEIIGYWIEEPLTRKTFQRYFIFHTDGSFDGGDLLTQLEDLGDHLVLSIFTGTYQFIDKDKLQLKAVESSRTFFSTQEPVTVLLPSKDMLGLKGKIGEWLEEHHLLLRRASDPLEDQQLQSYLLGEWNLKYPGSEEKMTMEFFDNGKLLITAEGTSHTLVDEYTMVDDHTIRITDWLQGQGARVIVFPEHTVVIFLDGSNLMVLTR